MAFNKWMHPENPYRQPPDFKALAIKHPDFRKHVTQDIRQLGELVCYLAGKLIVKGLLILHEM